MIKYKYGRIQKNSDVIEYEYKFIYHVVLQIKYL